MRSENSTKAIPFMYFLFLRSKSCEKTHTELNDPMHDIWNKTSSHGVAENFAESRYLDQISLFQKYVGIIMHENKASTS